MQTTVLARPFLSVCLSVRKSHMGFQLVPKSVTLNGVMIT